MVAEGHFDRAITVLFQPWWRMTQSRCSQFCPWSFIIKLKCYLNSSTCRGVDISHLRS